MSIGKWIKKGAVNFIMATGGVEKNALNQVGQETGSVAIVNPMNKGSLMQDLKEGKLTQQVQEFRKHHYQVLQASEKFKVKWGKDGDFKLLTEEEVISSRISKGDPYDNYQVEVCINNKSIAKSMFEYNTNDVVRPIKVIRNVDSKCKIEEVATELLVRGINGNTKLLEFYIKQDENPENRMAMILAEQLMNQPGITDFNNISNVSFTTPGGNAMMFSYKVLAFDKVINYNGNYIVKMFAECTNNGTWVAEKYMMND